ncbi:hypothetical protein BJY16_003547 [Actinoplanes octamycinicus]|uniref:Uncharacterized protein n=1 Tax=Actinoplanes octamycinicus TaxID=135948 RepID=A0A7W7M7R2_9ACTN|nr:hypothetical protein [Actinoplanes octamycinicus]MBB4740088.1 hypothetical protein [Actinoplanes octamycinicus]
MGTRVIFRRVCRAVVAGGVAVVVGLTLGGCPSSGDAEPVCAQPTSGTTAPDDCPDQGTVAGD